MLRFLARGQAAALRVLRDSISMTSLKAAVFLILVSANAFSQGYLSALEVNKKVIFDFYRLVFEPRNTDLIEMYVAEDLIEHNPQMKNGRAEVVKLIQSLP